MFYMITMCPLVYYRDRDKARINDDDERGIGRGGGGGGARREPRVHQPGGAGQAAVQHAVPAVGCKVSSLSKNDKSIFLIGLILKLTHFYIYTFIVIYIILYYYIN